MGPHPLRDDWGMGMAVALLLRSLDPGNTEETIQWGTVRKLRAAFSNVWQASVEGPKATVLQLTTTKMYVTTCPTNSYWFDKFANGLHKRQGDMVKPDMGLSVEQMVALMDMLVQEWDASEEGSAQRAEVLFTALFVVSAYLGGLRGEEVPLMDLAGMIKYLDEGLAHRRYPHVPLAMLGRFKLDGREKYHYIPISARGGSSLEIRPWVERMIHYYELRGIRNGRVFRDRDTGAAAKQGAFEYDILRRLVDIQARGNGVVPLTDDVFADYGVRRSARRGATTEASNMGVTKDTIDANNRWSAEEKAKGRSGGGSMLMHYTEVRMAVGKLIRFSDALLVAAASAAADG